MIHYYKVNCNKDNLKLIREFISAVLRHLSLSEIENNQLVLVVDEVCSNLIIHSHQCNPEDYIEINVQDFADKIIFEIIDYEADFFDPNIDYESPNMSKLIKDKRKGGVGLMLVHMIMDYVEVKRENSCNVWRLVKNLVVPREKK